MLKKCIIGNKTNIVLFLIKLLKTLIDSVSVIWCLIKSMLQEVDINYGKLLIDP